MKKIVAFAGFALLSVGAFAQTNLQVFYDFGENRKYTTTTLEMFKSDNWGSTFFFVDYNYTTSDERKYQDKFGATSTYMEIERSLNFWQDSKFAPLSAHVEFQAGLLGGSVRNWLFGADYFMHNADFSNTFTLSLLCKFFSKENDCKLPLQLSGVWGMNNLFGVEGLKFSGFFDLWGEYEDFGDTDSFFKFLSEPQIWYNVGQYFDCPNLNVGAEIELSANFAGNNGFMCNPCLGLKWEF